MCNWNQVFPPIMYLSTLCGKIFTLAHLSRRKSLRIFIRVHRSFSWFGSFFVLLICLFFHLHALKIKLFVIITFKLVFCFLPSWFVNIRVKQTCDTFEIEVNGHCEKDHFIEKLKQQGLSLHIDPKSCVSGSSKKRGRRGLEC